MQPRNEDDDYVNFKKWVKNLAPDMIWVNSYSMIIREDILEISKFKINIHGGLLPEYRGCNPIEWSIINKEKYAGVTMHEMTSLIDEGNIIDRVIVPIEFTDTWIDVGKKIRKKTDIMIKNFVDKALQGNWKSRKQEPKSARYFPRRSADDGLFSWQENTVNIYNKIRALVDPHPGAFFINKKKEKVVLNQFLSIFNVLCMKYDFLNEKLNNKNSIKIIFDRTVDQQATDEMLQVKFLSKKGNLIVSAELKRFDWEDKSIIVSIIINNKLSEDHLVNYISLLVNMLYEELNLNSFILERGLDEYIADNLSQFDSNLIYTKANKTIEFINKTKEINDL